MVEWLQQAKESEDRGEEESSEGKGSPGASG